MGRGNSAGTMTRKGFVFKFLSENSDRNHLKCMLKQYNCNNETEICVNVPGIGQKLTALWAS